MKLRGSHVHVRRRRLSIRYCERPFTDARSMDRELAERWNARVRDEDVVYHLGDFTLGGTTAGGGLNTTGASRQPTSALLYSE